MPARDWLLVFVGDDADDMRAAAAGAAIAGFERGAVLDGGLQAFGQAALQQVCCQTAMCQFQHASLLKGQDILDLCYTIQYSAACLVQQSFCFVLHFCRQI